MLAFYNPNFWIDSIEESSPAHHVNKQTNFTTFHCSNLYEQLYSSLSYFWQIAKDWLDLGEVCATFLSCKRKKEDEIKNIVFNLEDKTERNYSNCETIFVILQASPVHSGNYSCSVPDFISTPVRIHIVEGELLTPQKPIIWKIYLFLADENQAFVASGNTNISWKVPSDLPNIFKLLIYFLCCSVGRNL